MLQSLNTMTWIAAFYIIAPNQKQYSFDQKENEQTNGDIFIKWNTAQEK